MNHESYQQSEQVQGSSDRVFGLVFAGFFCIVGLFPLLFGSSIRLWSMLTALAFLLVAMVVPAILAPLNRLWTKFGLVLHRISNPIILGIMFFLVVTPTGVIMRALKKDLLRLKIDRNADSYWIDREPPGPAPEGLSDQF